MKKTLLIAALAFLSTGALAQSNSFKPRFYAGFDAGYAAVADDTKSSVATLVATVGGTASATQDAGVAVGRVFGGYKATENFDLEVGYYRAADLNQNFSGRSSGNVAYSGTMKIQTSGFDYSVLVRPNISSGWNNAFLLLGGQYSEMKGTANLSVSGSSYSTSTKVNGNGYLLGAGYDFNVANNIDIRAKAVRLLKIGGESDGKATVYQIGVLGKF